MAQKRDTLDMIDTSPGKGPGGGKIIGLVIALLVIGGVAFGYYFFSGDSQKEGKVATAPAPETKRGSPSKGVPPTPAPAPATPTPAPEKPLAKGEPPATTPAPTPSGPPSSAATPPGPAPAKSPEPLAKTEPPAALPPKAPEKPLLPSATPPAVKTVQEVVHFDLNQYQVKTAEAALLKEFWAKVKTSGGKLTIEGHACELGPADYNQKLSEKRAQQVAKTLASLGMDKQYQVTIKGYGSSQPVKDNKTPECRAENRRVVIFYTQ